MNKNEEKQFKIFKNFVEKSKNEIDDLFFGELKEVIKAKEPYDAIVKFKNGDIKHVQLTTMNNLVAGSNDKSFHAPKINLNPKFNLKKKIFDEKAINKNIDYYIKNNIKRKIEYRKNKKNKKTDLIIRDNYNILMPKEIDFDKKYEVETGGLINATYRAIYKKKDKYKLLNKATKSVLVILDESINFFYRAYLKPHHPKISKMKNWSKKDFLKAIFFVAFKEIKAMDFFDEIQVYYKIYNDEGVPGFICINNKMNNNFSINHLANKIATIKTTDSFIVYLSAIKNNKTKN